MINTAARATSGVKIPNRRQTRQAIIDTFKEQLTALRVRLTVHYTLHAGQSPLIISWHLIYRVTQSKAKLA